MAVVLKVGDSPSGHKFVAPGLVWATMRYVKALTECRLYTFVDTGYLRGRDPVELARQLCDGGADIIQLRAKDKPVPEVRELARAIRAVTASAGVGLVINDHFPVAVEVGAEFCHMGQEDFFDAGFRHVADLVRVHAHEFSSAQLAGVRLGLSSHAPEQALRAVAAGAAYIAVGPVYPTRTKPGMRPATLEYVRWAAQNVAVPWFAIGGITLDNLEEVLAAGAKRVCVVSAILCAPDVAAACAAFRKRLEQVR